MSLHLHGIGNIILFVGFIVLGWQWWKSKK